MAEPIKPRKKRDVSRKRETIMAAAVQAFQAEGFERTSMDRIAELGGVSKRTVYNHFPNKDALFQAIIAQFLGERHPLRQIPYDPACSLEEQLSEFIEAELFLINSPSRVGLSRVLTSVFVLNPPMAMKTLAHYGNAYEAFMQWQAAAQADGKLATPNPLLSATIFYALIQGALTWPALFQDGMDSARVEPLKAELIATFLSRYGT